MECSDIHNQQLADYLRFLRRKRDAAIAEVAAEFVDTKESRLFEEQYHVDDVVAIIDGLLSVVRSTMKRDLQTVAFSSVLLFKQACEQAEERGVELHTDLPATEDRRLLDTVEQWDQDVHGGSSSAPPPLRARAAVAAPPPRGIRGALPVIGQAQDPKLLAELQSARDDSASLQERFNRLQVQCTNALRDKSQLQQQLDMSMDSAGTSNELAAEASSLRAQVADLQAELQTIQDHSSAGSAAGVDQLMSELQHQHEINAQLSAELDAARAEASGRVERSTQFVNMRQVPQPNPTSMLLCYCPCSAS